ncbi:maltotransferase domain-containing protein [Nocardia cyriacigeorgica]|nr:maltotransferase domain-containing protein [Nocardia cyriacigeorgica]
MRGPSSSRTTRIRMAPDYEPDDYNATYTPNSPGTWTFRIEA